MPDYDDDNDLEVTAEQMAILRDLGIAEKDLEDLSFAEAETWIAELRALREDAGPARR